MSVLELTVDSISLDLILEHLDLADWFPDWLIEHRAIDLREAGLRSICLRAREAEESLKEEYGVLDPLLYHEDD